MLEPEERVVEFLQRLVRQCSYSGQEGGLIAAVQQEMQALGYDEVSVDECGNITGTLHGSLPGPRVIFDAHTDVVMVTTEHAWTHPPFGGELAGGRVWGRGSTDNKGSLAAMVVGLAALPRAELPGTLYVVGSVGEEKHEGTGLGEVVKALRPDAVVIGEPTSCRLGYCQRGRARLTFRVRGRAGHSSADDQSGNAVYCLGQLIARLGQYPVPRDEHLGAGIQAPIEVISEPYPSLSTIPVECRLTIDRRLVLGETEESVLRSYREWIAGLEGVEVSVDTVTYTSYTGKTFTASDFHPAWLSQPGSPLVQACQRGLQAAGMDAGLVSIPYCTNGSTSAGVMGVPAVVLGPGDIAQAHAMNEYLEVEQLRQAVRAYQGIARQLSGV